MNILFVGSTEGTSTSLHYFTSLVRQGHAVLPWNPGYFQTTGLWQKFAQRLNRGPTPEKVARINQQLLALCRHNAFDLVFVMGENYVSREIQEQIRAEIRPAPRFLFHSHDNLFAPGILKGPNFEADLAAYDILFTTKSQNVARYQAIGQKNTYYIPSAFEPSVHRPIPQTQSRIKQDLPVSFIGTYDLSREPLLEKAGWERLNVWGNGWERSPQFNKQVGKIHPQAIYYFEFADVCSRSQCSLGLLREEAEDRHTQRTFEIPACGSLQFAPRNSEIAGFFDENKEIVLFDSPEELRDKLDYYLAHPAERQKLAEAGHRRCLTSNHTYADRTAKMIQLLE
ncbi:glycosyltransferase [bacterium]|nr:glycosyltransferase [bacterium]